MKMDNYTKIILTVIAACLCWISVKDIIFIRSAEAIANQSVSQVKIINTEPLAVAIYAQVSDSHGSIPQYRWLPVQGIGEDFNSGSGFQAARLTFTQEK